MPAIIEFPTIVQEAVEQFGTVFVNEPERRHFAEYLRKRRDPVFQIRRQTAALHFAGVREKQEMFGGNLEPFGVFSRDDEQPEQ